MGNFAPLATVSRDGLVESTHLGDIVVSDAAGAVVASCGDTERRAYYRSSGKPLQALGVVQSGAADRFSFTPAELSVCCASHSGSALHVATVRGILEKLGLDHTALACGVHDPGDAAERNRLQAAGEAACTLHNNCSGKHAGMLATAVALGAPVEGYLAAAHPVQQLIDRNLEIATGLSREQFHYGADGCGAPTVGLPLSAIALSFARLAHPQGLSEDFAAAAPRIIAAMAAAPELVSAPGAFNSELLAAGAGTLVAKGGAEGLFVIGLADSGLGVALKMADGSSRAQAPVVLSVLERLEALTPAGRERLGDYYRPEVRNCHGKVVGHVEAAFEWERVR